jgi:glycosyltransferase involved in cell wall biosynthesis
VKIAYLMQAGVPDIRHHPLSGPAIHVREVFNELKSLGHQMRLVAYLQGQILRSDDLEIYEPVTVPWLDKGPGRWFEMIVRRTQYELHLPYAALFESLRFALACRQELRGFDLLYERMGWVGYGGVVASRWLGIPLILEVNGDHVMEFEMLGVAPTGIQRSLSMYLMRHAAGNAEHVVAPGEGWRKRFINRWEVEASRVSVVENGSQMVELLERQQLKSFQNSVDPKEPVTLIYVGSFDPWQGLPILIRAVSQVVAQGILIHLLLVGSGTGYKEIESLVRELHLDPYITLTGQLPAEQLAGCLKRANIGISAYYGRDEYSGLKLLDYKAAGLAIIATGKHGQPAILEHGRTGWIISPGDDEALTSAICELAGDMELRKKIGQAARIEAEKLHSWRNTAQELNVIFNLVISGN